MPRLGTDAIGMIQAGTPQRDVALRFGVHLNTIRSLWRRFQTTGSGSDRPRSGRPRLTSQRQDQSSEWRTCAVASRRLVSLHGPFQGCAVYTPGLCATVCVNTTFTPVDPACAHFCCHAIVLNVYGGHVPILGGVWENGKLYCSQMNPNLVWIIQMIGLWCTAGWASATKLHAFDRDVCLAVGVWWCGVASQPMAGHLVIINANLNAHRYLEEVVRPHVQPFVRGQRRNITFQQDNARPHVARLIMNVLRHENVLVMAWPSISPDLSPIEHVWHEMDRRLRQRPNQPVTLQGLDEALQEVWQEILQAFHANLGASMRRQECVNARGGHTHYVQCELLFDPHCVVTS